MPISENAQKVGGEIQREIVASSSGYMGSSFAELCWPKSETMSRREGKSKSRQQKSGRENMTHCPPPRAAGFLAGCKKKWQLIQKNFKKGRTNSQMICWTKKCIKFFWGRTFFGGSHAGKMCSPTLRNSFIPWLCNIFSSELSHSFLTGKQLFPGFFFLYSF